MPRERILLLMSEVFVNGGIQRFNRTLLAACGRLDVTCDVLALNDSRSCAERWAGPGSIKIRCFNHDRVRFVLAVATAALTGRYDVVIVGHINLLTTAVAAFALHPRSRRRMLLIAHGIEVWSNIHGLRRRCMGALDRILCVSSYTAQMISRQAPELSQTRYTIFPNALGETWTEPVGQVANPDSPQPEEFLLSVSRLDRSERFKGIVTALEAFSMIDAPSLHYVIAGQGNDQSFLEKVAMRLGVAERVRFLGRVSDEELARLYGACTAFVLPSGKEGFGIVFLEAMFFGAPVIAAAAGGAVDVVQHESTGVLVQYGDAVGLREAMERMLRDKELRARIRAAGRQTVIGEGRFTFHAYVRRLSDILNAPVLSVSITEQARSAASSYPAPVS